MSTFGVFGDFRVKAQWQMQEFALRSYRRLGLFRALHPRKFRLYHVGISKSGTHSIASVFNRRHLSAHEPEAYRTIDLVVRHYEGLPAAEVDEELLIRDERLYLELEASHLLSEFVPNLVRLFPDAKFILTLRDPISWLESVYRQIHRNQDLRRLRDWERLRLVRAKAVGPLPDESRFHDENIPSIAGSFRRFRVHHERVLATVPADRLMILQMQDIGAKLGEIARFAGVPEHSLKPESAHSYKRLREGSVIEHIPAEYVDEVARHECGDLMQRFFPDAKSMAERRVKLTKK